MLTLSITHKDLSEEEQVALEKLLNYVNQDFNNQLIAEHDTDNSEHKYIYQVHGKKKSNPRNAGRTPNIDKNEIFVYALSNPHLNITEIAKYFNCTKQYISKVLIVNSKMLEYKRLRKSTK